MRLTPLGKVIALILVVGFAVGAYRLFGSDLGSKLLPEKQAQESMVPTQADLPEGPTSAAATGTGRFERPGSEPGCTDKPEVRWLLWAWNSQMGAMLANGGPQATRGSLMCRNGVNLKMIRQDDVSKMQEELATFAQELKNGNPHPTKGAHFVAIMGDGAAAFLKGLNDNLKRLGPGYTAKIVGSCGYSRGEDKFMGPPAWKENPALSKGGVVAGVLRDGDWNIALKWLGDNGLRNNPDEKTWDPDALNWVAASSYIDASEKYISGYSEEREIVRNGKRTGQKKRITVNGVVTWTPGDVSVAREKGGLVSVVSTKEYSAQMPNAIIGIDKWMKDNRSTVEGMLQAIAQGSDLVKQGGEARRFAAEVSARVYNEENADYWERYYAGVTEKDKQGLMVELGGSSVNNLADNLLLFGMVPGSSNLFAATYKVFGDIVVQQYPDLVPNYPSAASVIDTSYLDGVRKKMGAQDTRVATREAAKELGSAPKPASAGRAKPVRVSTKNVYIRFNTGQATISPASRKELEKLMRDLLIASGTNIEIHGHTDSQGNPNANMQLSEARAFAVKTYLEKKAPVNFPQGRIKVFAHGQTQPLAPNSSEAGRARNRRVEIVLLRSS